LLSDLHLPGFADAPARLARMVDALEAEAVLIAGDLVETQRGTDAAEVVVARLAARWPTYVVFGGHDHYKSRFAPRSLPLMPWCINDGAEFRARLQAGGAQVLCNERTCITLRGTECELIGLADPTLGLDDLDRAVGRQDLDRFGIVLAHSPDVLPHVAARGLPLLLAGHTHGGQIAFPWIGAPITHSRTYPWRHPAGRQRGGRTLAYVGRGFGTTTVPLRFNARPEISVITLATTAQPASP
jgi:predicted MPP superfamily phosphohydrolase